MKNEILIKEVLSMKIYGGENNDYILKEIGQRIKDVRIRQKMTQTELAMSAGVAYNTILRIENGKGTNLENLIKVMRSLGLSQNLDLLIPEQELTPVELFQNKPKRKRVSKKRNTDNKEWKWGDEE